MKEINTETMQHSNPWPFFVLTYAITWIFWIPLALSSQVVTEGPWMMALVFGGLGPSIAGILMVYRTQAREGRRDFWRRSFNFKQIGAGWYAAIILIFPIAYGLGSLVDILLSGTPPGAEVLAQIAAQPASLIGMFFMLLLMGPLAEEFGWRGYALDQLQSKQSALVSNLTLGVFWFVWHFPLFFMNGMIQQELGFGSLAFWAYGAFCLAVSILIAWVYNNNGRSILAAILLHFMSNATTTVLGPISDRTNIFAIGILVVAAIVVVITWGAKTFTRQPG